MLAVFGGAFAAQLLQWSRNFRVAESATETDEALRKLLLQWSRNFRVAESLIFLDIDDKSLRFNGAATLGLRKVER